MQNRAHPSIGAAPTTTARVWIDFAKGAAIILVVLYHASLFLSEIGLAGSTPRLRAFLSFLPMAVFIFIAGLSARRSVGWSFPDLWRRRLAGLVYLYVLWSIIRVLFYLVVPHLRSTERSPTDLVTIILLPVWPTSSYWFVWALALLALIAWLVRLVPPPIQLACAGLLAIAFGTPGLLDSNNVGWDRVAQNLFFFLAAVYGAPKIHRLVAQVRYWHVAALALLYAVLAMLIIPLHLSRVPGLIFLEGNVAIALTVSASVVLARVRWLDFVSALGRASLVIYLLHLFVIASVVAVIAPLANDSFLMKFANLWPLVLAVIAIAVTLLLRRVLRRVSWLWVNPFRSRPFRSRPGRSLGDRRKPRTPISRQRADNPATTPSGTPTSSTATSIPSAPNVSQE